MLHIRIRTMLGSFLLLFATTLHSMDAPASVSSSQEPLIEFYCEADTPSQKCGIVDFSKPCYQVVKSYKWLQGNCCSLSDRNIGNGTGTCRLTVEGRLSFCSYEDGNKYYTHAMTSKGNGTCSPSLYKVPFLFPTPVPLPNGTFASGICETEKSDENCGMLQFAIPCFELIKQSLWSGTCCSFSDTQNGGCKLTVDGPGSMCTSSDLKGHDKFTWQIMTSNDSKCPKSDYDVLDSRDWSPYKICWAYAFTDCSTRAGCTEYPTIGKTLRFCQGKNLKRTAICVNRATKDCNHVAGTPVATVCKVLRSLHASGYLKPRVCLILKEKCRGLAHKIQCS